MFGRKKREGAPSERPAPGRQSRAGLYAMCGLYLGYLFFQLIDPYFTPGAPRPALHMMVLGTVILGDLLGTVPGPGGGSGPAGGGGGRRQRAGRPGGMRAPPALRAGPGVFFGKSHWKIDWAGMGVMPDR